MYKQTNYSPLGQIGMFILSLGVGIVLSVLGSIALAAIMNESILGLEKNLTDPSKIVFLKWLQGVSAVLLMGVPPFVFAKIVYGNSFQFLGLKQRSSFKQILFVLLLLFPALMLSGSLGAVAKMIPIPADWKTYFDSLEEAYSQQVFLLAKITSLKDYLVALLVMAILPAVVEELLFRGALQKMLTNISHKPGVAILITSIIFSAIHLSFYGFFARLFLGLILGYIFHYSRNIWLSILFHFLNNALVVTTIYYYHIKGIGIEKALADDSVWWYGLIGLPLVLILCHFFKKESTNVLGANITEEVIGEKPQEL
jgi:uncharacterized protein